MVFKGRSKTLENKDHKFPGGNGGEATPVPIPNTEVKLSYADGTWDAGPWKSRALPGVSFEELITAPHFLLLYYS